MPGSGIIELHMRTLAACLTGLFCFGILPGAMHGQTPAADSGVTFRTSAQEVNLELIVRDSHGRQVKNLKPDEVEIYENGVRQELRSFRFVGGREAVVERRAAEKEPVGAGHGPVANPLPAVNYVCIVFHNIDEHTLKYALEAAQQFLDRELRPGTGVALFSLGNRLTVLHRFTRDRQELMQMAAKALSAGGGFTRVADAVVNATPYQATVTVTGQGDAQVTIAGGDINLQAITGADIGTSQGEGAYRGLLADRRRAFGHIAGMQGWDQMNAMLDEIGPLPGRKTVLLLSGGLPTTGDPVLFDKLTSRANQGQITIYAVDVNGLMQNSNAIAGNLQLSQVAGISRGQRQISSNLGAAAQKSRQGDYIDMAVRTGDTQASLRALSEGTGGFLIANTENLQKPFREVEEDINTHYEAVYKPGSATFDGRFHKIEVRLARSGLNVQSRVGYYAIPAMTGQELTLFDMIGLAALNAPEQPHAFPYDAAMLEFRRTGSSPANRLVFDVPATALSATALAGGRHRLHVSVLALIKDEAGQVVDKFSQDAPYVVPDDKLDELRKTPLTFSHPVALYPGKYTVETAVSDREVNRVSVNTFAFDCREGTAPGVSTPVLVRQLQPLQTPADAMDPLQFAVNKMQAVRVVPELAKVLPSDARPLVYFVVYTDRSNSAPAKLDVEFEAEGRKLASQTVAVPAPNDAGSSPMVIKAAAHQGECDLKITLRQGSTAISRTLRYSVGGSK